MKLLQLSLIIVIALSLTGCMKRKDSLTFLRDFKRIDCCADYHEVKEGVQVCVKAYDSDESEEVFGKDLLSKEIQPLQIQIKNNTNDTMMIYPSYIELEGLPVDAVAPFIKKNIMRSIAPLALVTWLFQPLLIYIPVQMGLSMRKQNKRIVERLEYGCYTADQPIEIYPWSSLTKFLFVQEESFKQRFYLRLYNLDQRRMIQFNVECNMPTVASVMQAAG